MDTNQSKPETVSPADHDHGGISVSRRRFTRAGLSGSVVLGSLASKPVLGAVPYHCTVSGQVSGNLSRAAVAASCVLGKCPQDWIDGTWPQDFTKGTQPSKDCKFNGQLVRGTDFNGYSSAGLTLTKAFFNIENKDAKTCTVSLEAVLGARENPATMLQVLTTTDSSEKFVLGRVVVTSLLNAASLADGYPVTMRTIIAMFNATFNGDRFYPVDGTQSVTWNRTRVIEYLSSLYPSSCRS